MKKYPFIAAYAAVAISMALPLIANAETVKQKLQLNYQTYAENVHNNEDYRNAILEKRSEHASTTPRDGQDGAPSHPLLLKAKIEGEIRHEEGTSTHFAPPAFMRKLASSTEEHENRGRSEQVHKEVFARMLTHLTDELTHALNNLKQIRGRISARISLETGNGKDMTSAKTLLSAADDKISLADKAIQDLKSFAPAATTTAGVSATTTIDLGKPREIGGNAIKAVSDARRALNEVVIAIAKALGVSLHE
ncbi:MAG: hypothetical protein JWO00_557 [Candidatus Parcubacteria bacterium]|nr:hypothetical protein [Candidatus Parcubacteria bacterium]